MTLDIPKRGRGRPKKIVVEPDANKIIDIWLKEEPVQKRHDPMDNCELFFRMVLYISLTMLSIIGAGYLVARF